MRIFKCPGGPKGADCQFCLGVAEAVGVIKSHGLVVYPTDTVYGLGAKAFGKSSVERVFMAKGRPEKVPMPIAVGSIDDLSELADIGPEEIELLKPLQGEPVIFVLPAHRDLPETLLGGGDTIGVRVLEEGCGPAIIRQVGPITATSANVHGDDPPRTVQDSINSLGKLVDLYIDSGETPVGVPTTVVEPVFEEDDEDGRYIESVRIIREGAISGTLVKKRLLR